MKRIKRCGLAALFVLAAGATSVSAQENERECRCVDADGTEIEACHCFRTPDVEALVTRMGRFASGQPRLGISVDPGQRDGSDAEGARVTDVLVGGPADEAGLREGDVIISIDGTSLLTPLAAEVEEDFDLDRSIPVQRLLSITSRLEPGASVEVAYLRDGERRTTSVEVEDLSGRWGDFSVALPRWDAEAFRDRAWTDADGARSFRLRVGPDHEARFYGDRVEELVGGGGHGFVFGGPGFYGDGLELAAVNPQLGAYFGAEEGVLVLETGRSSGLGLQSGDVVIRIGARDVRSPEHFRRILASYGDDEDIDFHVLREGEEIVVTGRIRY